VSYAQSGTLAGKENGHLLQEKLWRMAWLLRCGLVRMLSEDAYETSPHGGACGRIIILYRQHCGGWRRPDGLYVELF
jgi:hypothetical protein